MSRMDEQGDELAKRVENFGFPVGKSESWGQAIDLCFILIILADDPNVPPVLIARLGKGQEIKARCIAKKVSVHPRFEGDDLQLLAIGYCKRTL